MINLQLIKELNGPNGKLKLDFHLQMEHGQFTTLYGPSGAGKTSILRMIAGLLHPDDGSIKVDDQIWYDATKKVNVPPQKRAVGMVFQDYALFPNMTIAENLNFALPRDSKKEIIREVIDIAELGELRDRRPGTLSGGQQQRVALARALVHQPKILLLDEPLSALDQAMRFKLQEHLLQAHTAYNLTTILVSHDLAEVFKMSDELVVLDKGRIAKKGPPSEVFSNKKVSGKFQFAGEVLAMEQQGFLWIVSILIGSDIVRIVAENSEAKDFKIGDKVIVASKAFNPIVQKIS